MICHSPVWDTVLSPATFWLSFFGVKRRIQTDDDESQTSDKVPVQVVIFRTRNDSAKAASVAKVIRHNAKREDRQQRKKDRFWPQPSAVALRAFSRKLESDEDIWVECFYRNKNNQRRYYYRSFNTGRCVLSEPPSGAQAVVYQCDLENSPRDIQRFAAEKLSRTSVLELTKERRSEIQSLKRRSLLSSLFPTHGRRQLVDGVSRQKQ